MELAYWSCIEDQKKSIRKRIGVRGIAQFYKVPKTTLNNRVNGRIAGFKHMSGGNVNKLFTAQEEQELVHTIETHSKAGFGFTAVQTRQLGFEWVVSLGKRIEGRDKAEQEKLSRHWFRNFMRRHPHLSTVTPQQLSVHRASCCNRVTIGKWFNALLEVIVDYDIEEGCQVWNVDETGLQDIPKACRIVGLKGAKMHQVVGKEKGETSTCVVMGSADGRKVFP